MHQQVRQQRAKPRVVVVGGGFGGQRVVNHLRHVDVEVMLIDQRPYATFLPLLYQVATGGLNPGDVTTSLRAYTGQYTNAVFHQGRVTGIDTERRHVVVDDVQHLDYDYLVVATGAVPNYFGVPGAAEHSDVIYTAADAARLRDRVFVNLEMVAQDRPGAREPVVVVVGGGPTGVELAGQFAELTSSIATEFPEIDPRRVRVVLVEMTDHVLGPYKSKIRTYAAHELRQRGVDLRLGIAVKEVTDAGVRLADGTVIEACAVAWSSGIGIDRAVADWGLPTHDNGRIRVRPDLRVEGHERVFAVGDVAAADKPLPQLAQPAADGGEHVAHQIARLMAGEPTEAFEFRSKGTMATIGRSDAVVEFPNGWTLTGYLAWLVWRVFHISRLLTPRNRIATSANLLARYLGSRRTTNAIIGDRFHLTKPDPA